MSRLVFDIEGNDLLLGISKIHCIATYDIDTGEEILYGPLDIHEGLQVLSSAELLIGHNITQFDLPALKKVYPSFDYTGSIIDTLLSSCVLYPDDGILSLEDWAIRLRLSTQKVHNEDWSVYTEHMGKRCQADVRINYEVYKYILANRHWDMIHEALSTEHLVSILHSQQTQYGVLFDKKSAEELIEKLDEQLEVARKDIIQRAPKTVLLPSVAKSKQKEERKDRIAIVESGGTPKGTKAAFKADGTYNQYTKSYFGQDYIKVKGAYTPISIEDINPDSKEQVKKLLLTLGWKPTEWNMKKDDRGEVRITSPKLTEDSYSSLPPGFGRTVADYNVMSHRRNWLQNKKDTSKGALSSIRYDGRVTPDAFTCGTPTARYRHSGTVCNIPRPTTLYGEEIRSLFCVPDDRDMVGVDLSGIEARMLAHYLLAGNYTRARETADLILSPDKNNDFHSFNAKNWGVSRDIAKNTLYALMYGAGAKKLASTAGKPDKMGAKLKRDFYKAHPGIKELIDDLERAYDSKGWIKGLDGRPLYVRNKMKLLNTLLQNAAAVIFKRWMIALGYYRINKGLDVHQIIAYHDELQFECAKDTSKEWAKICEGMAEQIGKEMMIKVPIEAKAKIGRNWRDTH